ncbi:MAG: IS66 family insertion sequence element accessory protein TnpB [Coprobacillus cateniformis]|nr:IS66 family insertion sequence element accessory protein TnpB [Coprobacillus cateniformis]
MLFLFYNKKRTVLEVLHWDSNGFELWSDEMKEQFEIKKKQPESKN